MHNADDLVCNIQIVNKQMLDLNRLRVFKAVWEQRNVSRAAEALGAEKGTVSSAMRFMHSQAEQPAEHSG